MGANIERQELREVLGLVGEVTSHIARLAEEDCTDFCKLLAGRFLIIELAGFVRKLCSVMSGDVVKCINEVKEALGADEAKMFEDVLSVSDRLVEGCDVNDEDVLKVLEGFMKEYIDVSRWIESKLKKHGVS
jgi:hypothetical protein